MLVFIMHHPPLILLALSYNHNLNTSKSSATKCGDCKEKLVFFLGLPVLQIRDFKQCSPTKLNCSTITCSFACPQIHHHNYKTMMGCFQTWSLKIFTGWMLPCLCRFWVNYEFHFVFFRCICTLFFYYRSEN